MSKKIALQSIATSLLLVAASMQAASGKPPAAAAGPAARQASFDREPAGGGGQTVRFQRRAAQVGDAVQQRLTMSVRLNTSLRRGNELVEKNQTVIRTAQRRVVTTTAVEGDRTTAVEVRYLEATRQVDASNAGEHVGPVAQPVQGKTYHCRRGAGEDAQLVVTEVNGEVPPPEELEIVSQHMEMVGRANPLAQFLAGRTVAVGDTVALPKELAGQLFDLGERFGEVAQFDLTLEREEARDGTACAVFLGRVEAVSNDSSQMRMQLEGPLVMQADTCRAVHLSLSGPIGMSETRGSYSTVYQLLGTGNLQMRIDSAFRDAGR